MNINAYLDRINYTGSREPSLEVLQQLQWTHIQHVPFENLDIHYNKRIVIDKSSIFEKIVLKKRGGFCYELNGLFGELLVELGFETKKISARVYDKTQGYGAEFDHLALLVTMDDIVYLVDVGFGAFTYFPLKLEQGILQQDACGTFIIDEYDEKYLRVNKKIDGQLVPEYLLTITKRDWTDFKEMCHYHQTHPNSHFTKNKLITIATKNGRITMVNKLLKITEEGQVQKIDFENEIEFEQHLWNFFNIKMKY